MGMYTGLRCKLVLKDEVVGEINQLLTSSSVHNWEDIHTSDLFRKRVYKEWSKIGRSSFIPFGALAYMPWKDDDLEWKKRIEVINGESVFIFQCSLKNYEDEIESFFKMVVPVITKRSIHIEYLYEEWETPDFYDFIDGAVVKVDKEGLDNIYD